MPVSTTDKILALIAHLGFFSGVGYFFAPLIVWLVKKDSSPFVAGHAKQAMVWQGACFVAGSIVGTICFVVSLATAGLAALILVPLLMLVGLLLLIPSVMASIKVFSDEPYSYPVTGAYADKL